MATITHKSGNSLDLPMQVTLNGVAYPLTGKTLRYVIEAPTPIIFELDAGLEVTDAAQGLYQLSASRQTMSVAAMSYCGSLRITDPDDPDFELELPDGSDPADPVFWDTWVIGAEQQPTT